MFYLNDKLFTGIILYYKTVISVSSRGPDLKGHSHAILVHFKNQKYVLTSVKAHK